MFDTMHFSRDKRFAEVSFEEFVEVAARLANIARSYRTGAVPTILTCEDRLTYNYSTVTFVADEVTEALKNRKSYAPAEFAREAWGRSLKVEMYVTDPSSTDPFMICLTVDRHADAKRMGFYAQKTGDPLTAWIRAAFAKASFTHSIGDGYSRSSDFNFTFGQRITGIRLSR